MHLALSNHGIYQVISINSYDEANVILVGVPMDYTCSFRPGTRFGPQKVREVSYGIEEFSFYQENDLKEKIN